MAHEVPGQRLAVHKVAVSGATLGETSSASLRLCEDETVARKSTSDHVLLYFTPFQAPPVALGTSKHASHLDDSVMGTRQFSGKGVGIGQSLCAVQQQFRCIRVSVLMTCRHWGWLWLWSGVGLWRCPFRSARQCFSDVLALTIAAWFSATTCSALPIVNMQA